MSEEDKMRYVADSGNAKAGQKRKRKISESASRNELNSIGVPAGRSYWTRAKKSESHTNVAKRSRKQNSKAAKQEKSVSSSILLTDLPNELLGKVMSYVSFDDLFNLERVNKRVRSVVMSLTWPQKKTLDHETLIRNTDYSRVTLAEERSVFRFSRYPHYTKRHNITNKSIKMIFSRANVQNLDLSIYHSTLSYQIAPLFSMAPQLVKLNLSFIRLTNNSLRTIARYCSSLEEVSFEQCFCDGKVEQGLENLFTKCQGIKYLNLAENNKLYGDSFAYIPSQLVYLNLANCYNVNANAVGVLAEKAKNLETLILENYDNAAVANFPAWLGNFTKLRFLEISNIFMGQDYPPLDFSSLKDLEMLCLRYNTLVKVETLQSLEHCKKLKALDLRFSQQIDSNTLDLLKKCKSLKFCNLSNCVNLTQVSDFTKHNQLEYLSINDCRAIPENDVRAVITECVSLRHLEIYGLDVDYHKLLPSALGEPCPQRRNILKLAVPLLRPICYLPYCNWCDIVTCEGNGVSPFSRFTNARDQYCSN